MSWSRLSPLQRRIISELVSETRDREPDREFWPTTHVDTRTLFRRVESYWPDSPDRAWQLQERNRRQSFGRAVHRLYTAGLVTVLALAWVNPDDHAVIDWHGGGSRRTEPDGYRHATPRFRRVSPTEAAIALELDPSDERHSE